MNDDEKKVVIAFLGSPRDSEQASEASPQPHYDPTTYRFTHEADRNQDSSALFAGDALRQKINPGKFIVLGTKESRWSLLLPQEDLKFECDKERAKIEGIRAGTTAVCPEMLAALEKALGKPYSLHLIEPGHDADPTTSFKQQQHILHTLHGAVPEKAQVFMDITHGLRSFPLLGLVSLLYLKSVKDIAIGGIYYGAYDLRTYDNGGSITPMVSQSGLLDIIDWVEALYAFRKDGDYAEFAPLLKKEPDFQVDQLESGAHWERVNRIDRAENELLEFNKALKRQSFTGAAGLFKEALQKELGVWDKDNGDNAHEARALYRKQRALAMKYLDHQDALRATLLGFEAVVTGLFLRGGEGCAKNYQHRRKFLSRAMNPEDKIFQDILDEIRKLTTIRNSFGHGAAQDEAEGEAQETFWNDNPTRSDTLVQVKALLDKLAPENLGLNEP